MLAKLSSVRSISRLLIPMETAGVQRCINGFMPEAAPLANKPGDLCRFMEPAGRLEAGSVDTYNSWPWYPPR